MGSSTRSAGSKIIVKWVNEIELRQAVRAKYGERYTKGWKQGRPVGLCMYSTLRAGLPTRIAGTGIKDQESDPHIDFVSLSKVFGDRQLIDWKWSQMAVRGFSSAPPFFLCLFLCLSCARLGTRLELNSRQHKSG